MRDFNCRECNAPFRDAPLYMPDLPKKLRYAFVCHDCREGFWDRYRNWRDKNTNRSE